MTKGALCFYPAQEIIHLYSTLCFERKLSDLPRIYLFTLNILFWSTFRLQRSCTNSTGRFCILFSHGDLVFKKVVKPSETCDQWVSWVSVATSFSYRLVTEVAADAVTVFSATSWFCIVIFSPHRKKYFELCRLLLKVQNRQELTVLWFSFLHFVSF